MVEEANEAISASDIESMVDVLPDFLADAKCPNCNSYDESMYHRVEGMKNVKFCSNCDELFGINDSVNVNDLRQLFEHSCACGNDDVDAFRFEECQQSGELYLKCTNCNLIKDIEIIPTDVDVMLEDTEDIILQDDRLVGNSDLSSACHTVEDQISPQSYQPFTCKCGNEENEPVEKGFDASGNSPVSVRCWKCGGEIKLWTNEETNRPMQCDKCGNNTEDVLGKTFDRSGQIVGIFCHKCETHLQLKESTKPSQRINSSESYESTRYLCNREPEGSLEPEEELASRGGTQLFEPPLFDSCKNTKVSLLRNSKRGEHDASKRCGGIYSHEEIVVAPPLFDSSKNTEVSLLRILKRGHHDARKRCGGIYSHEEIVAEALGENELEIINNIVAKEGTCECLDPDDLTARAASLPRNVPLAVSYEKTNVTSLRTLKRGDHIAWKRCGSISSHHAIVAEVLSENLIEVIHYTVAEGGKAANGGAKCMILRETVSIDLSKGNLYLCNYKPGQCLKPDVVVALAERRLGVDNYNLFRGNSEHFAASCKTAKRFSNQVTSFIDLFRTKSLLAVSYTKTEVTSLSTLKRGDHIAWERCLGIFSHHAIVVEVLNETELQVIHYNLSEEEKAVSVGAKVKCRILKSTVKVDVTKKNLYFCDYKPGECLEPDEVVSRAERMLGTKKYNLFLRNCEHFATSCKTARSFSKQVKAFLIGQLLIPVPFVGGLAGCTIATLIEHIIREM